MRKLILIIMSMFGILANAQESDNRRWLLSFGVGGNTTGYEADFSMGWFPVENFGVKLGLGIASDLEGSALDYGYYGYYDYYDYYDYSVSRIKLIGSVEMRSPRLLKWSDGNNSLRLFANPGIILSPGASGSHDADWHNWQLRGGLEADFSSFVMQLGYGYSDFNLYSGDPDSYYNYYVNPHDKTQSIFLNLGFRF